MLVSSAVSRPVGSGARGGEKAPDDGGPTGPAGAATGREGDFAPEDTSVGFAAGPPGPGVRETSVGFAIGPGGMGAAVAGGRGATGAGMTVDGGGNAGGGPSTGTAVGPVPAMVAFTFAAGTIAGGAGGAGGGVDAVGAPSAGDPFGARGSNAAASSSDVSRRAVA